MRVSWNERRRYDSNTDRRIVLEAASAQQSVTLTLARRREVYSPRRENAKVMSVDRAMMLP
jgi:hypothetical protein